MKVVSDYAPNFDSLLGKSFYCHASRKSYQVAEEDRQPLKKEWVGAKEDGFMAEGIPCAGCGGIVYLQEGHAQLTHR